MTTPSSSLPMWALGRTIVRCGYHGVHQSCCGQPSTCRRTNLHPVSSVSRWMTSSTKTTNNNAEKKKNRFLNPGFQPTAITGDNIGYYHGSTFYEGVPPDTLPILDLSVILSPGKYCKRSSWTNSQGTKSGVDAAQRLVEGRRELMDIIRNELLLRPSSSSLSSLSQDEPSSHMDYSDLIEESDGEDTSTRKIYSITGHGVPKGLLCQLLKVTRDWLLHKHNDDSSTASSPSYSSANMKITFTNTPNSTILNQHQIQVINSHGMTSTLPSGLPTNWEHDFEMYMVVMDRIGSRLASIATNSTLITTAAIGKSPKRNDDGDDDTTSNDATSNAVTTNNDEEELSTLGTSGSIITPSQLQQWNVTIMKGEALPLSLLPHGQSIGNSQGSSKRGRCAEYTKHEHVPKLTLEWIRKKKNKTSEEVEGRGSSDWNVILRLQDNGDIMTDEIGDQRRRDPVSLVFEGEYVAP